MYAFRSSVGPVDLAFTDRFGGASRVPFDELNLGINTADDQEVVAANLAAVIADFAPGSVVADMHQMHGRNVATVVEPAEGRHETFDDTDGLVTNTRDVVLVVRVADCVPVLLADPEVGVVGVAHAGRNGVLLGVVPATVERMRDLGARGIQAWVGPHICGRCYEVPARMQAEVVTAVPDAFATTRQGTPALDLGAGVIGQLIAAGLSPTDVSRCTLESDDLYSHRRDGAAAGRFAGLIRIRS